MTKPRAPRRWRCVVCGVGVTVYVELVEPPLHRRRKRADRCYRLEVVELVVTTSIKELT